MGSFTKKKKKKTKKKKKKKESCLKLRKAQQGKDRSHNTSPRSIL